MIYFLIFVFLALGLFDLISYKMNYPPYSTTRGIKNAAKVNTSLLLRLKERFVMPVIKQISPLIQIEEYKERRMAVQLGRAEIAITPKEYYAQAITMAVGTFVIGTLAALFIMANMIPVVAVLSWIVYFHFFGEIKDKLREKDKLIENELPKFVRAIVQGLNTEKDVIKLLETYETIAKRGLKYDVEVLIMDLKSGNFDDAMMDFDKRVGNAYVSRLSKALASENKGCDQKATLNHLLSDMALLAHESMQRELNKRPGKVKLMVIPIVLVGVFSLFYVIGIHLFNSLGGII